MAPYRLVCQRDQNERSCTDDEQEDADVEQKCARHVELSQDRQGEMSRVRSEKRMRKNPGADPLGGCKQESPTDQAYRFEIKARLHPACSASHVLQDDGDREREARDEPSARHVVATQKQV